MIGMHFLSNQSGTVKDFIEYPTVPPSNFRIRAELRNLEEEGLLKSLMGTHRDLLGQKGPKMV